MLQQLQKKYLGATIPLLNVHGTIDVQNAEKIGKRLSRIGTSRAVALAVSVDSPGGAPVQSLIIANKIKQFSVKHNLKVFTFARTIAASGGYFVLCVGDHVYADKTSLVGSIGVVFPKTNLSGILDMTSVQHKYLSSEKNSSLRDIFNPFITTTAENKQEVQKLCESTHEKFKKYVKNYRKQKLSNDQSIFNGQIYNGEQAQGKGLVDGVGSMVQILEKHYPGSKLQVALSQQQWMRNVLIGQI